jgi:hypothetical protein
MDTFLRLCVCISTWFGAVEGEPALHDVLVLLGHVDRWVGWIGVGLGKSVGSDMSPRGCVLDWDSRSP